MDYYIENVKNMDDITPTVKDIIYVNSVIRKKEVKSMQSTLDFRKERNLLLMTDEELDNFIKATGVKPNEQEKASHT